MAVVVGILGESGDGKTTSIIVNKDGSIPLDENGNFIKENYTGMNPETTIIINADKKPLPFPKIFPENNVINTSDLETVASILSKVSTSSKIKTVIIDTINGIMIDREMLESKKLTFDKWYDFAKDIYRLITFSNSLREDLTIYLMGHVALYTNTNGEEYKCLVTNGRKLEKIKIESKLSVVLFTYVESVNMQNSFYFETQKNKSTAKSPYGMFKENLIPNSLALVDESVRKYYKII